MTTQAKRAEAARQSSLSKHLDEVAASEISWRVTLCTSRARKLMSRRSPVTPVRRVLETESLLAPSVAWHGLHVHWYEQQDAQEPLSLTRYKHLRFHLWLRLSRTLGYFVMSTDIWVLSFTHLTDLPRADQALKMLQRIASLVKPILRKHFWKLPELAEFFPDNPNLLGE